MGLMRSITEAFGSLLGAALIYTCSAIFVGLLKGIPKLTSYQRPYLIGCGALFISYELLVSQAIGHASTHLQSIELGLVNYAWPCLTILFSVLCRLQQNRIGLWLGAGLSFVGVFWAVAGDQLSSAIFAQHVLSNPIAYTLMAAAAVMWALYCNVTRIYGNGQNGVFWFFVVVAIVLWGMWTSSLENSATIQSNISVRAIAELLCMGLFTALGYSFWDDGIQKGNMTLLVTASYFTPLLSTLIASWWLSTALQSSFWYAVLMVTIGSLICWWSSVRIDSNISINTDYVEN